MLNYKIYLNSFFISEKHNYFGHKDNIADAYETKTPTTIECVTQKGIVGDRFFNLRDDYDGQVTFMNSEVVELVVKEHQGLFDNEVKAELFRRNIMISGVNVIELIGKIFIIDGITFEGVKHCAPCRWMDIMMGKGVMKLMKGRGGLRARVISGGTLTLGERTLSCDNVLIFSPTQALARPKIPS